MQPVGTTYDDEVARHERLIASLARRPPPWKLQRALQDVVELWQPPDHMHYCLGGRVHWRVRPSAHAVAVVAVFHARERAEVRRLVLGAIRYGGPHGLEARDAVAAGLVDAEVLVRIAAARAAADLRLGPVLIEVLLRRLDDAVWTVRWNAALALGRTVLRPKAADVLLASQPAPAREHAFYEWVGCIQPFADLDAARERLASLGDPHKFQLAREA
ncbi:MAG TPA: hypothetical protein VN903_20620 [Polyangia bacterium]|jgi:hypothetical protein|nr:hypothetical protein [Polyangia bacterium]